MDKGVINGPMSNNDLNWKFDNSYLTLPEILYSRQTPCKIKDPQIVIYNKSLANQLGLNNVDPFPMNSEPIAQAYAGHQFGHFTILGDGRAILLGEHITPKGERVDVQLKGSGKTPYSRRGDGKATLGPMLREYIISEALHGLNIPTTRSLAVTLTGEQVQREKILPGAILTRIASSHIRVGTFQFAAVTNDVKVLKSLSDYTILRHYPHINESENKYLEFLENVISKQAELISKWQSVGFIHGVMNTDNMSICGESIDFGPCAFINEYDPQVVFSSIDMQGRYAFGKQPTIALWNLARLADSLLPLIDKNETIAIELAQNALSKFENIFKKNWLNLMSNKLGLLKYEENDFKFIQNFLNVLEKEKADYTLSFLKLMKNEKDCFFSKEWQDRIAAYPIEQVRELMKKSNPQHIPRNHNVEMVLEAAVSRNDFGPLHKFLKILENPFSDEYSADSEFFQKRASCSNENYKTYCGT